MPVIYRCWSLHLGTAPSFSYSLSQSLVSGIPDGPSLSQGSKELKAFTELFESAKIMTMLLFLHDKVIIMLGTSFNNFGISLSHKRYFSGKVDEIIRCTMGKRIVKISSTKINTSILSSVSEQIGENITDWKNDEKKSTYPGW